MAKISNKIDEIEKMYMEDRYIQQSEFEELREMIRTWAKERSQEFNA